MSHRPSDPLHSRLAAPAWSLPTFLLVCLLLRLPAVAFADGYEFLDQQYQYVDPAWHLATGQAWHQTWEWIDGMRSWVYPGVLAGIFRGLGACGLEEPMMLMRGVRAVHALVSLLPMWMFWLVVVRWRPLAQPRLPLLLFAGSGLLVMGVQPSGPSLAGTLAVTAGLALVGPMRFCVLAGLCLGFAFCCRFQESLFGPGFFAVLLWQRRWRDSVGFAAACVPGILLQGFVDLSTHGSFLATPWQYLQSNVTQGAASRWRTEPFLFYVYAGVVPLLVLVPLLLRVACTRLREGTVVLPAAVIGATGHLLAHSFIARKALRFEYAAFALLLAAVAVGVGRATSRAARWHTGLMFAGHAGLWLWASLWFGNAGAVQTANWLRAHGAASEVIVVGRDAASRDDAKPADATSMGDATSLGGFFYSRPTADRVVGVTRGELAARVARGELASGVLVVAVRDPLAAATADQLELVATFGGQFDLRTGERRFIYRRRP